MSKSPFDYVNAINMNKKDIMTDDIDEKAYVPFVVNRSLSYFPDTVLFANEMNQNHHLDNRLQFDFYLNGIRKKKRFSKWAKSNPHKDIDTVKESYGYNTTRALEVLSILTKEQVEALRVNLRGGRNP